MPWASSRSVTSSIRLSSFVASGLEVDEDVPEGFGAKGSGVPFDEVTAACCGRVRDGRLAVALGEERCVGPFLALSGRAIYSKIRPLTSWPPASAVHSYIRRSLAPKAFCASTAPRIT